MKGYERNHTCLPSGREVTERKLILCVLQTMIYMISQGLKENLRELDIFRKKNLFQSL